jgi:predicted extracellular nuclease
VSLNLRHAGKTVFTRHNIILSLLLTAMVSAAGLQRTSRVSPTAEAVSTSIVISQVYGGGGNAGSVYTNDFIELHNVSNAPVSVAGWSVQYASATGTSWAVTQLTGSIAAGGYYLVQEAQGTGGTTPLPTPDATGNIAMSGTNGKVALSNATVALTGTCPTATVVDFIGYGTVNCMEGTSAAPVLTNTTADIRAGNGCTDTDQNGSDFSTGSPTPRNSVAAAVSCGGGGSTPPSGSGLATPNAVLAGANTLLTETVTPGTNPASTGITVTGNLTSIGGSATQQFFDDATHGDVTGGDNIFSFQATVAGGTSAGPKSLPITVADAQARSSNNNISLTINLPPVAVHDIQGNGNQSPFVGQLVTTSGIVTGVKSNGFFLQTPDAQADPDPQTSEGVFVFTSSTPPAAAALGNAVSVTATVQEFIPSADVSSPPATELITPSVTLLSTGNPLPAAIPITAADTTTTGPIEQLERFEGMRVSVASLTVSGASQGTITEPSATVASTGVFLGVITGVARPFREPGIERPDPFPTPTPSPNNIPVFDANPERLRVDSDGLVGATALDVVAGAVVTNLVGPLDYAFRAYTIDPDVSTPPTVTNNNLVATPAPAGNNREVTIASANLERFFDTTDDPGTSDPILTPTAFAGRLNKASLVIRNVQRMPDVVGVEEMENLTTLQALATKINTDETTAGHPNPNYTAYLSEGNDIGGIDVGFLVKSSHVTVVDVTQFGLSTTYMEPGGTTALLNDRPPLVLRATVPNPDTGVPMPFTVIVNHLRSLSAVDDPVDGNRVRTKRREQALYLANLIQARQTADPNEVIVTVGDMNAFQINDGYVDSIGIIKGRPAPADQVTLFGADVVNPDLVDLVDTLPLSERYSYNFDGNAQVLDHILLNQPALLHMNRFHYDRVDSDFPVKFYADFNRPERISDHDNPIVYLTLAARTKPADYDGDGRTDFSVFRTGTGDWYSQSSLEGTSNAVHFGLGTDTIVPGDYDGDGRTDLAVFRSGNWYILQSSTGAFRAVGFGQATDVPVPADYDGDGKTDVGVFRNGQWIVLHSSSIAIITTNWGQAGDVPVVGNYDGDNKADRAVFRNGDWYILRSSDSGSAAYSFGIAGDTPVPGDYDGDGKTDVAVFRGGNWYVQNSSDLSFHGTAWGLGSDVPAPGNYDDDNKTDIAVFRDGNWYVLSTYTNSLISTAYGLAGDTPVPRGYLKP